MPTVGMLRNLLNTAELPDDWELLPNAQGNLAVMETTTDHPQGFMRHYVGYIDLARGEVHVRRGYRPPRGSDSADLARDVPGWPEQVPYLDTPGVVHVDRVDFGTSAAPLPTARRGTRPSDGASGKEDGG